MLRRSWVEIDLEIIRNNYNIYKSKLTSTQEIMAVVKADAYGHGQNEIAKILQNDGCTHFAVSNIDEGIMLRRAGIEGQIIVLGYTPVTSIPDLICYDITQTLISEEYAQQLVIAYGVNVKKLKTQFAIDTGMNRIGLDANFPNECEKIIRKYAEKFTLTGIFTHLCVADEINRLEYTYKQVENFRRIAERIEDLQLPFIHCMNSAGGLLEKSYGNIVRLGIVLYGLKPNYNNKLPEGIKPALRWKSIITMIKNVYPGETIGYGRSFYVNEPMKIATISTGYADGYNRRLSNIGMVLIHGKKAPIVGRICMDQMMVDVSNISDASIEDEVTLLWDEFTSDDMAKLVDTIGYEIVCGISKRVTRIYV